VTTERLEIDEYFLNMARLTSLRSTCARRQVGCILVDTQNHVVATGYNGVPKDFTHCISEPCSGASAKSGTKLDQCWAVHAEMNAMLQLQSTDKLTAYLTVTPCFECAKVLANSNITRIVAPVWYPHDQVKQILQTANIEVTIKEMKEWTSLNK